MAQSLQFLYGPFPKRVSGLDDDDEIAWDLCSNHIMVVIIDHNG